MQIEDPFALLRRVDLEHQASKGDVVSAAVAKFDPTRPGPLLSLLLADDPIIRRRGLSVFGSAGKRAFVALDAALKSVDHPAPRARSDLLDGVLCYPRELSPRQASPVLKLVDDPEDVVREKVIAFLSAATPEVIEHAIALWPEPRRFEFERGFQLFAAEPSQAQALFDQALSETSVWSTFALASLQRMAREGRLSEMPKHPGSSYIGQTVLANIERLARQSLAS